MLALRTAPRSLATEALVLFASAVLLLLVSVSPAAAEAKRFDDNAAWTKAHLKGPLNADQTRDFMKRLARYVEANHLKTDPKSPQRGMCYEYFDVNRKGEHNQWVQGEGLDTMHDGAWCAAAMVNAARATGDEYYKQFLTKWQLPFYLKMLNGSDKLFTAKGSTSRKGAMPWGKPWAFQEGEKGFVPYWWDDGASVSLERRQDKQNLTNRPSVNLLAGKPNPKALLRGYSLGMSNHMAQDLAVMLQQAWLLLKDSSVPSDLKLAARVAQGAANLHACRMRHFGSIDMCAAVAALCNNNAELMKRVRKINPPSGEPDNHHIRCLRRFTRGKSQSLPGFADDQQFRYYYSLARDGGTVSAALAFQTIYDAYTEPMTFRYYCDDWLLPAGVNRFDLHGVTTIDGRLSDYRSDRKGHFGLPKPIGSRMGPQNMIVCGWALQMLKETPGIWEAAYKRKHSADLRVYIVDPVPGGKVSEEAKPAEVKLGPVALKIIATRHAIKVSGQCSQPKLTIKLFDRPDCTGSHAIVTVGSGGVSAVNDQGRKLTITGKSAAMDNILAFEFELPYTVVKGQAPWSNGLEHCRYSISAGEHKHNLYLASSETQVSARLRHELGAGLRTWDAIFREKGYIPTGIGTGRYWDNFSDTGGYAHLISAASQWLLVLKGGKDWSNHNFPHVIGKSK